MVASLVAVILLASYAVLADTCWSPPENIYHPPDDALTDKTDMFNLEFNTSNWASRWCSLRYQNSTPGGKIEKLLVLADTCESYGPKPPYNFCETCDNEGVRSACAVADYIKRKKICFVRHKTSPERVESLCLKDQMCAHASWRSINGTEDWYAGCESDCDAALQAGTLSDVQCSDCVGKCDTTAKPPFIKTANETDVVSRQDYLEIVESSDAVNNRLNAALMTSATTLIVMAMNI